MGFLLGAAKFLGLVNSNPTASELAKDISSGVDMLVYTKEEEAIDKAVATKSAMDAWLRMVEMMKSSDQQRSITRRILALGLVTNLLLLINFCVAIEVIQAFGLTALPTVTVDGWAFTTATWAVIRLAAVFQLGWVLCTIIVFYFGPALISMLGGKK